MFSFRKKEKDKKKEKEKEKKEQKKKEKGKEPSALTEDELNKLDEVKKGLFRRHSEKESSKLFKRSGSYNVPKSESIDECMAGPSQLPTSTDASSADSMVTIKKINSFSAPRPMVPPPLRPKPKSILKGTSNYGSGLPNLKVTGDLDDSSTLQRNTKLNESQTSLVNANSETTVSPSSTTPNSSAKTQGVVTRNSRKLYISGRLSPSAAQFRSSRNSLA
eukprot:XP_014789383.1 PREDICTED: uncharacterized protein DDB_G0284459-like isoform X2 [Octopus bimaculoides]